LNDSRQNDETAGTIGAREGALRHSASTACGRNEPGMVSVAGSIFELHLLFGEAGPKKKPVCQEMTPRAH